MSERLLSICGGRAGPREKSSKPPALILKKEIRLDIKMKDVRLLYAAALFEPQRGPNGEGDPKHSATFGFSANHPVVAEIRAGFKKVAEEKWGAKAGDVFLALKAGDKLCLHDGDAKADKEGYKGILYLAASNKLKPLVIDGNLSPLAANSGKPYSGCYVNATVQLWAQDNRFGRRINASLKGVQFLRDGPRLSGGGVSSVEEYEAIPEAAGAASATGASGQPAGAAVDPFA